MIKDIPEHIVQDVAIAIVKEVNDKEETVWNTYLLNLKDVTIEGVLVTSTGYGEMNDKKMETSTLRHFLDEVKPRSFIKIEPIVEEVFGINNEYWLSFYENKVMYDKKYVFLPETINEKNFINLPLIHKRGVMIK